MIALTLSLFILSLSCLVSAHHSPIISFISKNKVVNIRDSVQLECSVRYTRDYSVVWLKRNHRNPCDITFISSGTHQIVPGQHYSILYNDNSGTYVLKIDKIQEIDAGLYECQIITGTASKVTANVWVNVRFPPIISNNSTQSATAIIGSTVNMHCYAAGYPPPRISWRREGNALLPTGHTMYISNSFIISNVTNDDRGTYYCIAENGVGIGARRSICLEVKLPSQRIPAICFISKEKVVDIGDTVELECTVQYTKNYSVVWLKRNPENPGDNIFISTGTYNIVPWQHYNILFNDTSGTYVLKIDKIQEYDAGLYECQIITGSASKITAYVWVHIRLPPVISDNSTRSVIASTGSTVHMHCHAKGYPPPRISWRRENNDLLPTGGVRYIGNSLTIFNLAKDDRGTYYCIADNGVGRGAHRKIGLDVEFRPYVTTERARYGQALQYDQILECHVESFPSASIVWLKDNIQLNDNQHYKLSTSFTSDDFTYTTLRIITAEKHQYGFYTCKATNKLGSHEKVIEFFETPNVICPPECTADL